MTVVEVLPTLGDRFAAAVLVLAIAAVFLVPLVTSLAVSTLAQPRGNRR